MRIVGQAFVLALIATVAVAFVDPWSVPALLLGVVLGIVVGLVLKPEPTPTTPGPVMALRRRMPATAPREPQAAR